MSDRIQKKINDKKRLFIAVDLPLNIKDHLFDIASGLHSKDNEIRPVARSNIHLTLKFLGETKIHKIDKISRAINAAATSSKGFNFSIGRKIEAFPDLRYARVVVIPVTGGADNIEMFFGLIDDNLSRIKIRKDSRRFIPHITIARLKKRKNISNLVKDFNININREYKFQKVTLFESILKLSGAEYIILEEFELK